MSDTKDIQTAKRLIEGYIGEGDPLPGSVCDLAGLIGDILDNDGNTFDSRMLIAELRKCGDWAVSRAIETL